MRSIRKEIGGGRGEGRGGNQGYDNTQGDG